MGKLIDWRSEAVLERMAAGLPAGAWANLYVPNTIDGYERMVERSRTAHRVYWCWFNNHPKWGSGIKVPINWWK